jgi:hypothetical protein
MTIKYGELTIIYNKEEQTILTNLLMWLKYDNYPEKKCKYVFLFDDGEICDAEDKFIDFDFKFCKSVLSVMPLHFEKNKDNKNKNNKENKTRRNIYFRKKDDENENCLVRFNELFSLYSKYEPLININSDYNGIYHCYKTTLNPEIFGLIRIKSNEYMPRFQFAYDSDEFTKEEIIYLIYRIFTPVNL